MIMKKRIFDKLSTEQKIEAIHDFGRFIGDFSENNIRYSLFLMSSYYLELRRNPDKDISEINTYNTIDELHQALGELVSAA